MSDPIVPAPSQKPPAGLPQQVTLIDIINVLADRADPVVKLLQAAVTSYQNGQEREVRFQKQMSLIAVLLVGFIVSVAALLTWKGKIDGSTFTFRLGLIVGYVLTLWRATGDARNESEAKGDELFETRSDLQSKETTAVCNC